MTTPRTLIRSRFDRIGVALSALCAVHCVSGLVLATFLGLGGGMLLDPRIHEWGLAAPLALRSWRWLWPFRMARAKRC